MFFMKHHTVLEVHNPLLNEKLENMHDIEEK